jgi:hypothetical protein
MSYQKWKDLKHKNSPEDRKRIRREAVTELLERNIKSIAKPRA